MEQAKKVEFLLPILRQSEVLRGKLQTLESMLQAKQTSSQSLNLALEKSKAELLALETKTQTRLPDIDAQLLKISSIAPLLEQLQVRGGSLALASQATDVVYSEVAWENLQTKMTHLPMLQQADKAFNISEQDVAQAMQKQDALNKTIQGLEKQLELLTEKGKQARSVFEEAKASYEQAVLQDQAALLREHLHQGDNCPVCNQVIAVLPVKQTTNVGHLKQQRDDLEQQLKDLKEDYAEVKANLSANKQRLLEQEQHLESLRTKRDEAKEVLEQNLQSMTQFGFDVKMIAAHLQEQKRLLLAALAASIQTQAGGLDVAQTQKRLQQEKRDLSEQLKSAETKCREIERNVDKVQTELTSLKEQLEQTQQEQIESQTSIDNALAKAAFASVEAVKQAALNPDEMKRLELNLSSYTSQKENTERRDVELQAKLSGRTFDTAYFVTLQENLKQTHFSLDEVKDRVGRTKQQLSDIEVMLERASQLRKESEALSKVFDTYDQLSKDLRGNNFQDYLLNQMQAKLASRASHMIREVTEQRYDLRLLDSEYQVFDAWTQESRSVKTLSGGETFIASLALALALSDLLAGSKALGALFLDEGFGTLDAETLELVADVLETLSHQGRMVGVITHVQALSERLPARLTVKKSSEGSSISWDL